jgi:DNA primase
MLRKEPVSGCSTGFTHETIAAFRLGSTSTERITFPICDEHGTIQGFQTRVPHEEYKDGKKYVNSPNTEVYNKSNHLFGIDIAKGYAPSRGHKLYVAEGNFDVMRMHQVGMRNTVGVMGALISPRQAFELDRFANEVVLVFDGDDAGIKGMCASYENMCDKHMNVSCILIEGDPDTFFKEANPLPDEMDMLEFYVQYKYSKHDISTVSGKYEFVLSMVTLFSKIDKCSSRYGDGAKLRCLQIIENK